MSFISSRLVRALLSNKKVTRALIRLLVIAVVERTVRQKGFLRKAVGIAQMEQLLPMRRLLFFLIVARAIFSQLDRVLTRWKTVDAR